MNCICVTNEETKLEYLDKIQREAFDCCNCGEQNENIHEFRVTRFVKDPEFMMIFGHPHTKNQKCDSEVNKYSTTILNMTEKSNTGLKSDEFNVFDDILDAIEGCQYCEEHNCKANFHLNYKAPIYFTRCNGSSLVDCNEEDLEFVKSKYLKDRSPGLMKRLFGF